MRLLCKCFNKECLFVPSKENFRLFASEKQATTVYSGQGADIVMQSNRALAGNAVYDWVLGNVNVQSEEPPVAGNSGVYRSMATEHGHEWLTPMLKLVEQIQAADYVGNVYGSTSHLQLRISYLPEFDPDKEVLNVDFNRASGQFEFEYQETASPLYKRWKRKCPANDAFPVFNRFLQLSKWFPLRKS